MPYSKLTKHTFIIPRASFLTNQERPIILDHHEHEILFAQNDERIKRHPLMAYRYQLSPNPRSFLAN